MRTYCNSCRKDLNIASIQTAQSIISERFDPLSARDWYDGSKAQLANKIKLTSETSFLSKISAFTPLWDSARLASDTNYLVVEAPAKYINEIKFTTDGTDNNANGLSRLLILKDKRNGYISAALMQVHGEPGVNINNIHYGVVPSSFSGSVFYTTIQGIFVNGYVYADGNIVLKSTTPAEKVIPGNPQILTTPGSTECQVITIGYFEQTCYYNNSDVLLYCDPKKLLYTEEYTYCPAPSGGGGGGYNPPCPPGTSPGGPNPPTNPEIQVESLNGKKIIRLVQGGEPPPGGGGNCTVNPPVADTIKFCAGVTPAQQQAIKNNVNALKTKDCIAKILADIMAGKISSYCINPGSAVQASYNPVTKNIFYKDPAAIDLDNVQEEFFHAYQDMVIPGGTAQYLSGPGSANIEFEAKVIRDISSFIKMANGEGGNDGGISSVFGQAYIDWLSNITNNFTTYPSSFTSSQTNSYFGFMQDFKNQNPFYSNTQINPSLMPQAIFSLINISNCLH